MAQTCYICWYRLDRQDRYLIWYSNETDGVIIDADNHVLSFNMLEDLNHYAEAHNLPIKKEIPNLHDLDAVATWLENESAVDIDCKQFLAVWNLFGDVSVCVGGDFDPKSEYTRIIYDKLFWGNNLPPVTPTGKKYMPVWTDKELQMLRAILAHGLALFRQSIKIMEKPA